MAITARNQLKQWFETGDYPTQEQFANWLDSFWHKTDELIPIARIEGLSGVINNLPIEGTVTVATPLELVIPAGTLLTMIVALSTVNNNLTAGYAAGLKDVSPDDDTMGMLANVPLELQPYKGYYAAATTLYFEATSGDINIKIYKQ